VIYPNIKHILYSITAILIFSVFFIQAAGAQTHFNSTPPEGPSDPAEVEAFLDYTMSAHLAQYNIPGATVAVVKDGELVLAKGYGYSDIGNRTPVVANQTSFRIASVTKLFTWTLVMQLVSEKKIDLDADVNNYLKDFQIPDTYPGEPITMRHLMTHTAGFEDRGRHMWVKDINELLSYREYCARNFPARVWPPGTVTSYSNYGTILAGVIVEDVSGMPFEDCLQSRILSPLGMSQTSINQDLPPDLAYNLSVGYMYSNMINRPEPRDLLNTGPAATITTTATDIARFLAAHMENGTYQNTTILPADAARLMHAQAFANDPRASGMCLGFYEMNINNRRLIAHAGDWSPYHSLLIIIPDEKAGFFVSYNGISGYKARDILLEEFMDHYYPADAGKASKNKPPDSSILKRYAGTYEINRHSYTHFEKYINPAARWEVAATPNGTLLMFDKAVFLLDSPNVEFIETEPGVFTRLDGTHPASGDIIFHTRADGTVEFLSFENIPEMAFDRVPWYKTDLFIENLKIASGMILATVLLWPLLFVFRRVYQIPEPSVHKPACIARWIAGIAALIIILFIFVLLPWVMGNENLIESYMFDPSVPALLSAVLTLPVIAAIFSVATAVSAIIAWKEKYWTLPHRVHYTIITIALFAILWWVKMNNVWVFSL
jgi:CubicO group peptidase (beta-lactamase class C family)